MYVVLEDKRVVVATADAQMAIRIATGLQRRMTKAVFRVEWRA